MYFTSTPPSAAEWEQVKSAVSKSSGTSWLQRLYRKLVLMSFICNFTNRARKLCCHDRWKSGFFARYDKFLVWLFEQSSNPDFIRLVEQLVASEFSLPRSICFLARCPWKLATCVHIDQCKPKNGWPQKLDPSGLYDLRVFASLPDHKPHTDMISVHFFSSWKHLLMKNALLKHLDELYLSTMHINMALTIYWM